MKPLTIVVVLLIAFCSIGCVDPQDRLGLGEHRLRKMVERTDAVSQSSTNFFLVVGSTNTTTKMVTSVKFAWETDDGYAISALPLEMIRVKLDEKAITPTVRFKCRPDTTCAARDCTSTPLQELIDMHVAYAVITVRESDWPVQIRLPLNQ